MSIKEYITTRFQSFNIYVSEADLLDMCLTLDSGAEVSVDNIEQVKLQVCKFIPTILGQPNISQGGISITRNTEGLKSYYEALCSELGVTSELSPRVTFLRRRKL